MARVRDTLAGAGFLEARTIPLGPAVDPEAVPLRNPLSAEEACLRSHLLPGLIRRVEHNWAMHERDVRLFEVGTVFRGRANQAPEERLMVGGVATGARRPPHWSETVPDMDIWDLKRHFELAVATAFPGASVGPGKDGVIWSATAADGRPVGHAKSLQGDAPKWAGALLGFEVEVAVGTLPSAIYVPLPTQPAAVQDLSLVLPDGVLAANVERRLRQECGPMLERLTVLDEYRGASLPAGTRGVTWRCVFRDPARTLRDRDVDEIIRRALTALEGELGVRRRTG